MKSFNVQIPQEVHEKDMTIIYKDGNDKLNEIKANKEDIVKSFTKFKKQQKGEGVSNVIYIEEKLPFDIFNNFINVIYSHKLELNESNYRSYLYLSEKYENEEVQQIVKKFIDELPKTTNSEENKQAEIENDKEEILAQNLDICIKNGHLKKLPIQMLVRILTSPKRVINDHHLLFKFVIDYLKEKKDVNMNDDDRTNFAILPSSLDFCLMTNDEIIELFNVEEEQSFNSPLHANEKLRTLIENENDVKNQFTILEQKVNKIESLYKQKISELEQTIQTFKASTSNQGNNDKINDSINEVKESQEKVKTVIDEIQSKHIKTDQIVKEIKDRQIKNEQTIQTILSDVAINNNQINQLRQKNIEALINNQIHRIEKSVKCDNGIFKYLYDKYKSSPIEKGIIEIDGNSNNADETQRLPKIIDSKYAGSYWYSEDIENSYIKIKFQNSSVLLSKYWIRAGLNAFTDGFFTSWIVKGINEENQEVILDEVNETKEITPIHPEITRDIQSTQFFKSVEFIMVGKNKSNCYKFRVRNIELFGFFTDNDN